MKWLIFLSIFFSLSTFAQEQNTTVRPAKEPLAHERITDLAAHLGIDFNSIHLGRDRASMPPRDFFGPSLYGLVGIRYRFISFGVFGDFEYHWQTTPPGTLGDSNIIAKKSTIGLGTAAYFKRGFVLLGSPVIGSYDLFRKDPGSGNLDENHFESPAGFTVMAGFQIAYGLYLHALYRYTEFNVELASVVPGQPGIKKLSGLNDENRLSGRTFGVGLSVIY